MTFCTECGERLPDGSKFCGSCGHRLADRSTAPSGPPQPEVSVGVFGSGRHESRSIKHSLLPGESVVYVAKPALRAMLFLSAFFFGVMWIASAVASHAQKTGTLPLEVLGGFVAIVAFFFFVLQVPMGIAYYLTGELVVTTHRIVAKRGLIRRKTFEIMLPQVEGVGISQTFTERLLGTGTISVTGTGAGRERMRWLSNPNAFRQAVRLQVG